MAQKEVIERYAGVVYCHSGIQDTEGIFEGQLEMVDRYIVTKTGLSGGATAASVPYFAAGSVATVLPSGHHVCWRGLHGCIG